MAVKDADRVDVSRQVSGKSVQNGQDTFFAHSKEERENRLVRFSQVMEGEDYARLESTLKLFDGTQDVMGEEFERHLEQYFDGLISLLEKTAEKQSAGAADRLTYCQALEELYLINCEKVKRDNSYRIYGNHPLVLMNRRLEAETEGLLEGKKKEAGEAGDAQAGVDYDILRSVFDAKKKNRRKLLLYSRSSVYETESEVPGGEEGFIRAQLFEQREGNTEIPTVRILEKIRNYRELHTDNQESLLKIAVFGELKREPYHRECLKGLLDIEIKWTEFHRIPEIGEYLFIDEAEKEEYDLMDMLDLQALVDRYQIILFLDQNCFYRQWQAKKETEERSEGAYSRWNLSRSRKRKTFRDKAALYRLIYNRIGRWINSADEDMSAAFEFDERLYENLEAVQKENTDIYLYIKYGDKIGEHSLANNGICNDEYYDGTSLTVCKLARFDEVRFNQDYKSFLKQSEENMGGEFCVPIRFWKLLKSISNEYCGKLLERYGWDAIRLFEGSYVVLKYSIDPDSEQAKIIYYTREAESGGSQPGYSAELTGLIQDITAVVLKYAFGKEKMYCMNRYFENLLIFSIIANANDIGDLILAHWMATNWYTTEKLDRGAADPDVFERQAAFSQCKNKFKVRKTIYSIIDRLDDMRMRSIPDMRGYFFSSFRGRICPEVEPENMEETFHMIQRYCELFSHTGGYLYTNSKLIDA